MNGLGLKTRIILYSIIPALLIGCAMTGFFSLQKYTNLNETLIEKSKTILSPLSTSASFAITQNNLPLLQGLINESVRNNSRYVLAVAVFDQYNKLLATTTTIPENNLFKLKPEENEYIQVAESVQYTSDGLIMRMPIYAYDNESLLTLYGPSAKIPNKIATERNIDIVFANPKISYPRQLVGYICIYYLNGPLVLSTYTNIFYSVILSILGIFIAFCFGTTLIRIIIDPINRISSVIHEIKDGNVNVKVHGIMHGELERLRSYINSMVYTMGEFHNEMQFNVDTATNDLHQKIDKLKEVEDALAIAKNDAEESAKIKNEFLANMSHELRTPLNGILGFTRQLNKTILTKEQVEYLQTIERSAKNLLSIVNNILDFTKLESRKLTLESIPFSVRRVCYDTVNLLSPTAHTKGIELTVTIAQNVHDSVIGDPIRLGQILTNLLGNSLKFTQQGNVSLEISVIESKEAQRNQIELLFVVKDTGIGISKAQQDQLFTAFTQADSSISRKYGGTGLGLVITKHLIEQMHGAIKLQSTQGQGSTFSFNIILERTITQLEQINPMIHLLHNKRIAVVETNTWVRASLTSILTEWEMQCVPMSSLTPINTLGDKNEVDYVIVGLAKDFDFNKFMVEFSSIASNNIKRFIIAVNSLDIDPAILELSEKICIISKPVMPSRLLTALTDANYINNQRAQITTLKIAKVPTTTSTKNISIPKEPSNNNLSTVTTQNSKELIKATVLAVDDNEANLLLIKTLLSDIVTDVYTAMNGHQAIELCSHTEFDLIFMDIQMPDIDGVTTMKTIHQNSNNAKTPIVAVTALVIKEEQERFITQGMSDVLAKPLEEQDLISLINKYCTRNTPLVKTATQALAPHKKISTPKVASTDKKQKVIKQPPVTSNDTTNIPGDTSKGKIWNVQLALKQCANKKSLAKEMLNLFIETIPEMQKVIKERQNYTPKDLAPKVHKLAGGSVYCGIKVIKTVCNVIEEGLKTGSSVDDLEPEFLDLTDLLDKVQENYKLWLKALD